MKIGIIVHIDQRNGSGYIRDERNGLDYRFSPEDLTYTDYEVGDKVAYEQADDTIHRWATKIYKASNSIEDRLSAVEKRVAKLESAYNITPDTDWIEGMHKSLYGDKKENK